MARCAKGLPIGTVPEQALVAAVRNDVIHNGCKARHAMLRAFTAMGMHSEIVGAGFAPFVIIAACGCGRAHSIMAGAAFLLGFTLAPAKLIVLHNVAT